MSTEVHTATVSTVAPQIPAATTKTGRVKRIYKCRDCQKVFKRSEHCARHERVHTQERPFPCHYCDRRYARKSATPSIPTNGRLIRLLTVRKGIS